MKKISKDKIKTWFVTGASSGIGNELCKQLLERGYNVIAVSRRIPEFNNENALCLSVDVTEPETIAIAIEKGLEKFGKIDVLVNNAGISAAVTLEEETLDNMRQIMETDFFGTFNTIHAILPHFRQNKNGTIINNTSMHGLSYRAMGSAYCSSKHAVEGLTSVLWHETKSFCRVMAFELGVFNQTEVASAAKVKETKYPEYKTLKNFHKTILYTFNNKIDTAVSIIIDQIEKEKIPRYLILGKDAYIKVKAQADLLRKNLRSNKSLSLKPSVLRPDILPFLTDKIKKYLRIG